MLIKATAVLAFLIGSSSAFAPSSNVHGVSSTRLNLDSEDKDVLASNPSVDDRRSFVTKVSVKGLYRPNPMRRCRENSPDQSFRLFISLYISILRRLEPQLLPPPWRRPQKPSVCLPNLQKLLLPKCGNRFLCHLRKRCTTLILTRK